LYAWVPKRTGVVGEHGGYQVPVTLDDIPGESADFASAVDARDGDSHEVWQLQRVKRYGTASIDWETVRAMKNDMGAFMRAVKPRINSAINQVSNSMALHIYGDGSGARGIATTAGGGVIVTGVDGTVTLDGAHRHLARGISLRRKMVGAADAGGGTVIGGVLTPTTATVTGVDIKNGIITFDDVPVTWVLEPTGLYLFPLGDYQNSVDGQKNIDGMGSWGTAPAGVLIGDIFKGVERAKFKDKLLMLHFDASEASDTALDAVIREAASELQSNEGSPDALFVNPLKWAQIETVLASQSRYEMMMGSDGRTGFDSIVINAGGGKINVVADPWCPPERGYMLQRDSWEFFSIDTFPDFVSDDGSKLHRLERSDSVEFRIGGYCNTVCKSPGHNMVINFDA
jgi:hypothetical protein